MSAPINNGGPAFPCMTFTGDDHNVPEYSNGMTLRDWFAGQALAGMLANPRLVDWAGGIAHDNQYDVFDDRINLDSDVSRRALVFKAGQLADSYVEMIAERAKGGSR